QAADALQQKLGRIGGVIVERKPFSVAVHYRLVGEEDVPMVLSEAALQTKTHPSLRMLAGKKVVELRPDTDWNKGKAVLALADRLGVPHEGIVYVGDDVTDEDAFEAIRGRGIGVAVMGEPRHTAAAYILRGEDAVGEFLEGLLLRLQRNENF
ncbi:MAG: trehalose-phosphatase, partial [Hyphomicrobiaceae bacterium]